MQPQDTQVGSHTRKLKHLVFVDRFMRVIPRQLLKARELGEERQSSLLHVANVAIATPEAARELLHAFARAGHLLEHTLTAIVQV